MSRRLLVAAEAQIDIAEAVRWLEDRSSGAAGRFQDEVERSFERIVERPEMFPAIHSTVHRALLRHFPYSVFYAIDEDAILILGVIHQARHPSTWKERESD